MRCQDRGADGEQQVALNGVELRPSASNVFQLHPSLPAASRCRRSESVRRPVSPRSAPWFCAAVDKALCHLVGGVCAGQGGKELLVGLALQMGADWVQVGEEVSAPEVLTDAVQR